MMWRLFNRLFGWQYVHMENTCTDIVRRVYWTAGGEPFVRYFSDNLVFIGRPRTQHGWHVTPLTAPRTKRVKVIEARTIQGESDD